MDAQVTYLREWIKAHYNIALDDAAAARLGKVNRAVQRALDQAADPNVFDTEPARMERAQVVLGATEGE